jgi:thermitase
VAGAAALWLAAHGKRNLLARYQGRRKLAEVFRHLLRATARVPAGWKAAEHGAGILDVGALLQAALPSPRAVSGRDWTQYSGTSELQILRENLGNPNEGYLLAVLAKWFGTTTGQVQQRLDEFGTELLAVMADVPRATEAIREALDQQARSAAQAVDDAVEEAVQAAGDAVSNALGTVMGWLS